MELQACAHMVPSNASEIIRTGIRTGTAREQIYCAANVTTYFQLHNGGALKNAFLPEELALSHINLIYFTARDSINNYPHPFYVL